MDKKVKLRKRAVVLIALLACLLVSSQPASTSDCTEQSYLYSDSGYGLIWGIWMCAVWGDGCREEIYSNCSSCIIYGNSKLCNKAPMVDDPY